MKDQTIKMKMLTVVLLEKYSGKMEYEYICVYCFSSALLFVFSGRLYI